jgi:hypothetical protein
VVKKALERSRDVSRDPKDKELEEWQAERLHVQRP